MPILHVRNVPEPMYQRLRQRAQRQHRSLSAEVINLLEGALERQERSPEEILASLRGRPRFRPAAAGAPDSTALLREDRER